MISVIVPVYNVEKYLDQCVNSIINQTYTDLQIILINDGSTDNSLNICNELKEKDNRIEVFNKKNTGPSDTRNVGIELARGEYIIFVDSDDWIESDMCERLIENACNYSADFVFCSYYNESSNGTMKKNIYKDDRIIFEDEELKNGLIKPTMGLTGALLQYPEKLDALVPIWCRLYKTEIIKNNRLSFINLNEIPSECQQFNLEYAIHITKAVYINECLYHYRRNNIGSVTKGYRTNLLDKWTTWCRYNERLIADKNTGYLKEAYYSRIAFSVIPLGGNAIKNDSVKSSLKEIKEFLYDPNHIEAFKRLEFQYFKPHWKIFFWLAKYRCVLSFYIMTKLMRWVLSFRKR